MASIILLAKNLHLTPLFYTGLQRQLSSIAACQVPMVGQQQHPHMPRCLQRYSVRWTSSRKDTKKSLVDVVESELEESFQRGWGPGGQATNKTNNCVLLKHVPTGIVVKCHQTRSLDENRKIARQHMREKLDLHVKGEESVLVREKKELAIKKREKRKKANKNLEKKKAFKQLLQESDDDV
ncbi:mitochondrial translation release factor in rescue-like [Branchiostoma lanceolatum]|uniref:mitochondrial translation release factor in rescue-like n=1 Tax=Branchiostoma lanceolatum TaxID=7740 RepID=UPI003456B445